MGRIFIFSFVLGHFCSQERSATPQLAWLQDQNMYPRNVTHKAEMGVSISTHDHIEVGEKSCLIVNIARIKLEVLMMTVRGSPHEADQGLEPRL